jgi:hypothetical protein
MAMSQATTTTRRSIVSQTFITKILKSATKNVTGIVVPPSVVAALGTSKRPAVQVTLNGYTYPSTVASKGGQFMISLSSEHRKAAGLEGNEQVKVTLALGTEPRAVEVPADLKAALVEADALDAFERTAPFRRKEFVRQVQDAKTVETRQRRIVKVVESLRA